MTFLETADQITTLCREALALRGQFDEVIQSLTGYPKKKSWKAIERLYKQIADLATGLTRDEYENLLEVLVKASPARLSCGLAAPFVEQFTAAIYANEPPTYALK